MESNFLDVDAQIVYVEGKERLLVGMDTQGRAPENPRAIELACLSQSGRIDGKYKWRKIFQGTTTWCPSASWFTEHL